MSTSYFGRRERDGRHLGADFDLLAKWSRNFGLRAPVHSYHLSQLSNNDQTTLFSGAAHQFRLRQGPNNTVKLETVEDGVSTELSDQTDSIDLDPDVVAMMRSANYVRSEARNYELLCEVDDAQDESQAVSALKLSDAIIRGFDGETAEKIAEQAASDVLVSAGQKVLARWKAARLERLIAVDDETPVGTPKQTSITLDDIQFNRTPTKRSVPKCDETPVGTPKQASITPDKAPVTMPKEASIALDDIQFNRMPAERSTTAGDETAITTLKQANITPDDTQSRWTPTKRLATLGNEISVSTPKQASITLDDIQFNRTPTVRPTAKVFDHPFPKFDCPYPNSQGSQATPRPQPGIKCPSPHAATPDYGSETTVGSVDSGSPTYSFDEVLSSPEFESVDSFIDDADGGAGLLSFGITEELGLRGGEAAVSTPTPAARFFDLHDQASGGHLGAGLRQAFFALPGASAMLAASAAANASMRANAFNAVNPAYATIPFATDGMNSAAQSVGYVPDPFSGHNGAPDASAPVFTPEPKTPKYPVAKDQPWTGFTCYDVSYKPRNDQLIPKYWTTKLGKERYIRHKIRDLKLEDTRLRSDRVYGSVAREPIHIFVDLSNITIGFYNSMKEHRGIPEKRRVVAPAFSFKNFDTILTRDRNVTKRIVAGSLSNTHVKKWPEYMLQARDLKYEMNILQRVLKPASPSRKRKSKNGAREPESPASGPDTSGDDAYLQPMKQGEQGVDELLHLKILQSAMDTPNPGTMVLATGDAASAEYSDGFKKNIERVLALGWHIELYGWRRNISSAWREPEFAEKWQHQFKIVELDEFCEELFDMTIESLEQ
ncbi:NYN domain-containing protein [Madurella fahalii]|uniref:NYN domain-containing protein n=1 Tax=Madurella fahalii TaxID=1157608 RepID=A0ABQ0GHK0_9PEZI